VDWGEKNQELSAMLYNRAIDLIKESDLSQGIEMLYRAVELSGENEQYLDVLGLCLFARGNFREARVCWEKSGQYQKNMDAEEFHQYIRSFNSCLEAVEKGKYAQALSKLLPALQLIPNVEGYNLAGLLFYQLGMKKSALRLWKKSLSIDLGDKKAAYYMAHCQEGWLFLTGEKILWGVLSIAGKLKLL